MKDRGNYEDRVTPDTGFQTYSPELARVKFNGGRGALLCNYCSKIIRQDFDPKTIEDKEYFCDDCHPKECRCEVCRFWS